MYMYVHRSECTSIDITLLLLEYLYDHSVHISVVEKKLKAAQELSENFEVCIPNTNCSLSLVLQIYSYM